MFSSPSTPTHRHWAVQRRVAVLGSSISIQKEGYIPHLKQLLKDKTSTEHQFLNASIGGTTSRALLFQTYADLFYDLASFRPEIALIEKAPNDRIYDYQQLTERDRQERENQLYADMSELIHLLRRRGCEPVLVFSYFEESPEASLDPENDSGYLPRVYKRLSKSLNVQLVDVASRVRQAVSQASSREEIMIDSVHLAEQGAAIMASTIAAALLQMEPEASQGSSHDGFRSDAESLVILKPDWNDSFETSLISTGFCHIKTGEIATIQLASRSPHVLMGAFIVSDQTSGWVQISDDSSQREGRRLPVFSTFDHMSYLPRVHFVDLRQNYIVKGRLEITPIDRDVNVEDAISAYHASKMFDTSATWAVSKFLEPLLERQRSNRRGDAKIIALCLRNLVPTASTPRSTTVARTQRGVVPPEVSAPDVLPESPQRLPCSGGGKPDLSEPLAQSLRSPVAKVEQHYWPGAFDPDVPDTKRHYVMLSHGLKLIESLAPTSLLTIGDRFGRDAGFFKRVWPQCHCIASDLNASGIQQAIAEGHCDDVMDINVESIPLPDQSIDIVVAKETFHHWARPMVGFYEMLRVAKQAILLIEPNDYMLNDPRSPHLDTSSYYDNYEDVGNYLYRASIREWLKSAWALRLPQCATSGFNDPYRTPFEFEHWLNEKKQLDKLAEEGTRQYNLFAFAAYKPGHEVSFGANLEASTKVYQRPHDPFESSP